jgi:hypothetical protein
MVRSNEECLKPEENDCNHAIWKALDYLTFNKREWTNKSHGLRNQNLDGNNFISPTLLDPHNPTTMASLFLFHCLNLVAKILVFGHASFIPPCLQVVGVVCRGNI